MYFSFILRHIYVILVGSVDSDFLFIIDTWELFTEFLKVSPFEMIELSTPSYCDLFVFTKTEFIGETFMV